MPSKVLKKINDIVKGKALISSSRSSSWPKVRAEFLKNNFVCTCCGGTNKLEVHHIFPFYSHPELELNTDNLIVLCEDASNGILCHLAIGHLGSYKSFNTDVANDAKFILQKICSRP